MSAGLNLINAMLPDGRSGTIHILGGRIVATGDVDAETIDLGGRLLLPALAEPHAHLDKAFTADRFPNPTGDLASAIDVMRRNWPSVTRVDIEQRAEEAAERMLYAGVTAIRSHGDLNPETGTKSIEALLEIRERRESVQEIQVVALAGFLTGPGGREGRSLLRWAIGAGLDVVGSCPHIEDDPIGAIEATLAAAAEAGLPVDLHFDEVLDPAVQHLPALAAAVERHGLEGRVTASHCVSHGLLPPREQRRVAALLAAVGIGVVTNPRTNLFLQARGLEQAAPRGMAGLAALADEGVLVAAGADNLQDPFSSVGRADPLETAALLVAAGHRTIDEAAAMVGSRAWRLMGLEPPGLDPGDPADLVAVRARSVREAIADQPADRLVFRRGGLVARTTVERWRADD